MSPVQKTGLYYPNKFGLIIIKSLEEVMGKNGLNAILNRSEERRVGKECRL